MQAFSVSGSVFEQQLVFIGSTVAVPPLAAHVFLVAFTTLHFGPLVDWKQHVTNPALPQLECAAHFLTAPLQSFGRVGLVPLDSVLTTPATQLT